MKLHDLTNKRFNKLTAIRKVENKKGNGVQWLCKCDCGNYTIKYSSSLVSGKAISCGCHRFNDLRNKKFGKLTPLELIVKEKKWKCQCDCGNITYVFPCNLVQGKSTSCGCFQKQGLSNRAKTHGLRKTRLYSIWANMKQRCYNTNNNHYKNYGSRGIKVCEEWLNDFMTFYNWAMENGYKENLTIDRIDVNGNYEPSNCRWATTKEQSLNTTKNHYLTFNNETHTIKEWADIIGISSSTLNARINYYQWTIERALTEKSFYGKNQYYKGGNGKCQNV